MTNMREKLTFLSVRFLRLVVVFILVWFFATTLAFLISYYQYLQHYLLCPFTCGKGCLCLAAEPSHKSGATLLFNQVKLIFESESFSSLFWVFAIGLGLALNIFILILIFRREKSIYANVSAKVLVLSVFGALFGGCLSCNLALIYPVLSFLGLSGVLTLLPYKGKEIMAITSVLLFLNAFFLLRRYKTGLSGRIK